jgi:hypothetical protein
MLRKSKKKPQNGLKLYSPLNVQRKTKKQPIGDVLDQLIVRLRSPTPKGISSKFS